MSEIRLGRQTPTVSVVLPYQESKGSEAIEIYNKSGRTALQWQELMIEDIMAIDDEGKWVHMKFGWSIPRRNGKSEDLIIRAIWGVIHGERILYTAHGEIHFRTRASNGGLGEGFDLLITDEAQKYTSDQESALKYLVTDSKNPQTLMCGTPPTAVSSGDVFERLRKNVFNGKEEFAGWAEWSVSKLTDAHNPDLWYETNPSLGTILTERTIRSELGDDQVDDNIQRLGLWISYSQKSAITEKEWMEYKANALPKLVEPVRLFYGVKYAKTSGNVSLAVAVKTKDGKIFVEAIDCRPVRDGNDWIIAYLRGSSAEQVVIDGAAGAPILLDDMKNANVKCKSILPKVSDIINVNSLFETNLFAGMIAHTGQPSLVQAVSNCQHRPIGTSGGFGYHSLIDEADVSLVEAVALAHWACAQAKEKKRKQQVTY